MKDVSNKTLALLVLFSIIVSVSGLWILTTKQVTITGLASYNSSGIGTVSITVPTRTYINVTDDLVNLGTIDLGLSNNSNVVGDYFFIENDGNVNINVSAYSDVNPFSADCFGDGTSLPTRCYQIKCNNTLSGTCVVSSYTNVPNSAGTAIDLVKDLQYNTNDGFYVAINVTVPLTETPGAKSSGIVFTGYAA